MLLLRTGILLVFILAIGALGCSNEIIGLKTNQVTEERQEANGDINDIEEIQDTGDISISTDEKRIGGTFTKLWDDPPTLDPHLTTDTTSATIVVEIFSGLVAFNPDLELVPDLAERWDISEDSLTYTFYLRPEAKFHDGKPVTANDVKWSLERAVSPELGSPVAHTYLGDIVGVSDVLAGVTDDINGVKVIDEHTLEVHISEPKAHFLAKMAYHTAFVLDKKNIQAGGSNWTDKPNGTGPFKLKEYKVGERIILERYDDFYLEPAYLDRVVLKLAGGQAMAMYENDEIDMTGVGLLDLERIRDPESPLNKEYVIVPPSFSLTYIGFNTNEAPFDDLLFRQALNHAINKEMIAREIYEDLLVPAYGILPPRFPGYNANLEGLRYNTELAKQLLQDSQYADPDSYDPIVITVPGAGGALGEDLAVIIEMWNQTLGIEVEIQQVEWATYLEELNRQALTVFAGLGWSADYPDPQDFLDILFHSESEINHGAYKNKKVDDILEQARIETNVVERMAMYNKAEELIVHDAPLVPLWFSGDRHALIKSRIKDYKLTPMIVPKLRYVHISN